MSLKRFWNISDIYNVWILILITSNKYQGRIFLLQSYDNINSKSCVYDLSWLTSFRIQTLFMTALFKLNSREQSGCICTKLVTYISPLMYSSLFVTVALASSRSCFTNTGPISLKTVFVLSNKSNSWNHRKHSCWCPRLNSLETVTIRENKRFIVKVRHREVPLWQCCSLSAASPASVWLTCFY